MRWLLLSSAPVRSKGNLVGVCIWSKVLFENTFRKPIWKGCVYDSSYMSSGKGKTVEIVKRSVVGRGWGEGMNRGQVEDFQGNKITQHNTTMMDYTYVQTHRIRNTKNGPQGEGWTLGDCDVSK